MKMKKAIVLFLLLIVIIAGFVLKSSLLKDNTQTVNVDNVELKDGLKFADVFSLFNSADVSYDNTNSGLTSTTVQDAIDELYTVASTLNCRPGYIKQNDLGHLYECRHDGILPSTISVEDSSKSLTYGTNGQNTYTYNGDGTVSCLSSNTSKVTCSVNTSNHKIVVTPVGVTTSAVTITVSASQTSNYYAPTNVTFTVTVGKKALTANSPTCSSKSYDGSTSANCTVTFNGVLSGDSVTPGYTCTYGDASVGTSKAITCTSFTVGGTSSGNYSAPTGSVIGTADITALKCAAPTNVSISTAGVVTWTKSSNCSSATHQISIDNSSFTDATSGVNYKSTIIGNTGSRTVYVRAVAPNTNYSNSNSASKSTTVYSVSLTKGSCDSVSGGGNFITGASTTIAATNSGQYYWINWTGSETYTSQSQSITVNGNKSFTANCGDGCASGNIYDSPSCDANYGACSVPCQQFTGTKSRTCTHVYYSSQISGYLCSTGSTYTETVACNGATNCGSWHAINCSGNASACAGYCQQYYHTSYWSTTTCSGSSYAQYPPPSAPYLTTGGNACTCLY